MNGPIVYLARHGQSLWNRRRIITGQLDPDLAPDGELQARELAALLRDIPLTAVYASDLTRSRRTAEVVARSHDVELRVVGALREQHFGALQGRFRDERDPAAQLQWQARTAEPLAFQPEGGESFAELLRRVGPAARAIVAAHPSGAILIVGHRNTNRAILATLMGWSPEDAVAAAIRHDCLFRLQLGNPPGCSAQRYGAVAAASVVPR